MTFDKLVHSAAPSTAAIKPDGLNKESSTSNKYSNGPSIVKSAENRSLNNRKPKVVFLCSQIFDFNLITNVIYLILF